jgi:hypothetical protein
LISAGTSDRASTGSIWAAGGVVGSHVTCNATTFSFAGYDIRTAAFLPFTGAAAAAAAVFGEQLSCRDSCRASLKDDMMRWVLMSRHGPKTSQIVVGRLKASQQALFAPNFARRLEQTKSHRTLMGILLLFRLKTTSQQLGLFLCLLIVSTSACPDEQGHANNV